MASADRRSETWEASKVENKFSLVTCFDEERILADNAKKEKKKKLPYLSGTNSHQRMIL